MGSCGAPGNRADKNSNIITLVTITIMLLQLWALPCLFLKIEKSTLILEKEAPLMSIFELNFPFKMWFEEYLGKKIKVFPCWAFFSRVFDEMFIDVL